MVATSSSAGAGHSNGLPEPQVKAKVSGKGAKRFLTYDIKPIPGQKVRFEERAPGAKAAASLGYATGTKGRIRFAPASTSEPFQVARCPDASIIPNSIL